MTVPTEYNFVRYLAAKKTVDDRALNLRVWNTLAAQLAAEEPSAPLRVLEIGAGIGTMIERALEWNLFPRDVVYTALDTQLENIQEAQRRLPEWAARHSVDAHVRDDALILANDEVNLTVRLETGDAFEFAARETDRRTWDVLIANAFLDIVNIPVAVSHLLTLLKTGGLFYFTITFDGVTAFEPPIEPALDRQIEALYHANMDARRAADLPTGGSNAGRALLRHLLDFNMEILASGASDWVIYPDKTGYPADEAYFLHFIIHTIENALLGHPDLDTNAFANWISRRQRQVEAAELIYIAHQLDVLGRVPR
jgi:SAM-dependent methyltransferase